MDASHKLPPLAPSTRLTGGVLVAVSLALAACSSGGDSGSTTPPTEESNDVRLYLLWGQSHLRGGVGESRVTDVTDPEWLDWAAYPGTGPYPEIEDCWIYDKAARGRLGIEHNGNIVGMHREHLHFSRIDDTPSFLPTVSSCWSTVSVVGDECQLRPMSAGYAGGEELEMDFQGIVGPFGPHCQMDDFYPWIEGNQVPEPRFGPEVPFARAIRDATGDEVVIVKLAIGGTSVNESAGGSWNPAQTGDFAYLRLFEEVYFDHAVELATAQLEPGQRLLLGGVISSIGLSDMRPPNHLGFEDGYRDIIHHLRGYVSGAAEADDVPYLIVQTPTPDVYLRPEEWEIFYGIRDSQVLLADTLPGVDEVDPDEVALSQSDGEFHFDSDGNIAFGNQMAAWAASVADSAIVLVE